MNQKTTNKNGKNYWPAAIVGIILFGMCIVAWGVYISIKNPAIDDLSYWDKKRVVDERINDILTAQSKFEQDFGVMAFNGVEYFALKSPYLRVIKPRMQEDTMNIFGDFAIFFEQKSQNPRAKISDLEIVISSISGDLFKLETRISHDLQAYKIEAVLPQDIKQGLYLLDVKVSFLDSQNSESSSEKYFTYQKKIEIK